MHTLTVGKLFYDRTGSALAFGIVIIAEYAISFLLQIVAGPFVDRGSPKLTSVYADLIRGLFILTASFMLSSPSMVWWVIASIIVMDIAKPFYVSATFAIGPALVPDELLVRYNSRSAGLMQMGQLLGVALVGPIIQNYSINVPFALNGFSFLFAAFAVWIVKIGPIERKTDAHPDSRLKGFIGDWKEIGMILRSNWSLSWHILLCAGDFLVVSWVNLSLVPLVNNFGGNTYWLSVFDGCFAIGAMIAAVFAGRVTNRLEIRNAAVLGIAGETILFLCLSIARSPFLVAGIMIAMGAFNAYSATIFYSYLQRRSRGPIKGRVSAVRYLMLSILAGISLPLTSLVQNASLQESFWVIAVICAGFSILTFILGRQRVFGNLLLGVDTLTSQKAAGEKEGIAKTLLLWLGTPSFPEERNFLEEHPELLVLETGKLNAVIEQQIGNPAEILNSQHAYLLRDIRQRMVVQIRAAYINMHGGLVLDLPTWLEEVKAQLSRLDQQQLDQTALPRMELLEQAINRAKNDFSLMPEISAELRVLYAIACLEAPLSLRAESIEVAIVMCKIALQVYTLATYPYQYARTHVFLSFAYQSREIGRSQKNLELAMASYKAALEGYKYDALPVHLATAHLTQQSVFAQKVVAERQTSLEQAIIQCQKVLQDSIQRDVDRDAIAKQKTRRLIAEVSQLHEAEDKNQRLARPNMQRTSRAALSPEDIAEQKTLRLAVEGPQDNQAEEWTDNTLPHMEWIATRLTQALK